MKSKRLSTVLQYLKLCTFTAVQEYVERQLRPQHFSLSDSPVERMAVEHDPIEDMDDRMQANKVWGYVITCAKSEQERIVAEDYFYLRHDAEGDLCGAQVRKNRQLIACADK